MSVLKRLKQKTSSNEGVVEGDSHVVENVVERLRRDGAYAKAKLESDKAIKKQHWIELLCICIIVLTPFVVYLISILLGANSKMATSLASQISLLVFGAVIIALLFIIGRKDHLVINLKQFVFENNDKLKAYLQDFVVAHYGKVSPLLSFSATTISADNSSQHTNDEIVLTGDHIVLGEKKTMTVTLSFNQDLTKLSVMSYTTTDHGKR